MFSATEIVKTELKRIRNMRSVNMLMTNAIRTLMRMSGGHWDFFIKHLPKIGMVESRLPNGRTLRFESQGNDWVPNQVFWLEWSGYEPESARVFYELAKRSVVTLDIGAHIGFYALLAAHANPIGSVYAFEPVPETFQALTHNVKLNHLDNVRCFACALSASEGTEEFFVTKSGIPCSAGLSSDFYQQWSEHFHKIPVKVTTVDSFVNSNQVGKVDLVKIDTETTEPQVLTGMQSTLFTDRPVLICEVLGGYKVEKLLEKILREADYSFFHLTSEGIRPASQIEAHPSWLNYLFLPEEKEISLLEELGNQNYD